MKKDIEWLKEELTKREDEYHELWLDENKNEYNEGLLQGKRDGFKQAIDLLNQLDKPETLSQEWIDEHSNGLIRSQYVWVDDLQNVLVPKQEEVDQAYKDGYEKGKEHATEKQSEETETVASVLVDYLIASAKLKLALSMEVKELEE